MNPQTAWPVIRVVLALLGIFAGGVWVGRMTAPPPMPFRPPLSVAPSPTGGRPQTDQPFRAEMQHLLELYRFRLNLTPAQVEKIVPLLERATAEMRRWPPRSPERHQRIARFHEEIAELLTAEQREQARRLIEEAEGAEAGHRN
ncbi:MAG: hypothetical protein ACK45B_01930 [Limisphaerales bacterium]|jgi:hypothetical protein